jgi:hypothetical protein
MDNPSPKTCVSEWHKKFSEGREYVKAKKMTWMPGNDKN